MNSSKNRIPASHMLVSRMQRHGASINCPGSLARFISGQREWFFDPERKSRKDSRFPAAIPRRSAFYSRGIFYDARGVLTSFMQRHGPPIGCNGTVATFLARHRHIELFPYQLATIRELDEQFWQWKQLIFGATQQGENHADPA